MERDHGKDVEYRIVIIEQQTHVPYQERVRAINRAEIADLTLELHVGQLVVDGFVFFAELHGQAHVEGLGFTFDNIALIFERKVSKRSELLFSIASFAVM